MSGWKLELWDAPEYESGSSRVAFVDIWSRANMKLSIDGTDTLTIVAPWDAEWLKSVAPRQVLKVTDELDRVTEWRIVRIFDGRGSDDAITQLECESLLTDLARPLVVRQAAGGAPNFAFNVYDVTATQLIDQFITPRLTAEGLTHYVKGTISTTETMTFAFERYSCLELITEICDRTSTERWIERDDVAGNYKINIGTRGASEPTVRTAFGRGNLQSYVRDRDSLTVSTVTIPTGKKVDGAANRSTLGFNAWKIVSATGTVLELADPAGGDGPIAFDDQLNGLYALRPLDGGAIDITDSSATGQTITVANWSRGADYIGSNQQGGFGTLAVVYPPSSASGDLIVAHIFTEASGVTPTITAPTGWTQEATRATGGGGKLARLSVFSRIRSATGAAGTFTATGASIVSRLDALRNFSSTGYIVDCQVTGSSSTGSPITFPAVSTSGRGTQQLLRASSGPSFITYSLKQKLVGPSVSLTEELPDVRGYALSSNTAVGGTGLAFNVDDHVQIVADQDASLAYELTSPSGISALGRIVGTVDDDELREERNWFRYGLFTGWSTGNTAPGTELASSNPYSMKRITSTALKQVYSATVTSVTTTGANYEITTSGLPLGSAPAFGDLFQTATGRVCHVLETRSIGLISPTHTLLVTSPGFFLAPPTGVGLFGGPSTNGSLFQFSHNLPESNLLRSSDTIRVKYVPNYETLWASVGFTTWSSTTSTGTTPTGTYNLRIQDAPGGGTLASTDYDPVTYTPNSWTVGGPINYQDGVIRTAYTLSEEVDVAIAFQALAATGLNYFTNVRWMQLHLGTDSQVPPIYGSHGNRIWQRGNQHLRVFGTSPTTYQVALVDLVRGEKEGLAIADDGIALGGKIKLIDADIGEVDLRIVELRLNAENPYDSTVTLATIPPRLAKIARRARFAPPTRPDPTPPTQKPADEEPGAPLPTILAPDIQVTTPATIKLVGDVWSLYA